MDTYTLKELQPSQWHIFKTLRIKAVTDEPAAFLPTTDEITQLDDTYWQSFAENFGKNWTMIVANKRQNDENVSTLGLEVQKYNKISHIGKLWYLYVAPVHRNHGVAKQMLTYAIEKARHIGLRLLVHDVFSTQISAIKLYQSSGFQTAGVIPKYLKVTGKDNTEEFIDKIDMYYPL